MRRLCHMSNPERFIGKKFAFRTKRGDFSYIACQNASSVNTGWFRSISEKEFP